MTEIKEICFDEKSEKTDPLVGDDFLLTLDSEDTKTIDIDGVPTDVPKVKIKKVSGISFGGGSGEILTNEVYVDPNLDPVAGKVFPTFVALRAYFATLDVSLQPSLDNPWLVQLPSGRFDELVVFQEGLIIQGRGTLIHTLKSEFCIDPSSGFGSALENNSFVSNCVIERFDFSNATLSPSVSIPIMPLTLCVINDQNTSQNGVGVVLADNCNLKSLKFAPDASLPILGCFAFNCTIVDCEFGASTSFFNSSIYSCKFAGPGLYNCTIDSLDGGVTTNIFEGGSNDTKIRNCHVRNSAFKYNSFATTLPLEIKSAFSEYVDCSFEVGERDGNVDSCVFHLCSFDSCLASRENDTVGEMIFSCCDSLPEVGAGDEEVISALSGDYIEIDGEVYDSHDVLRDVISEVSINKLAINNFPLEYIQIFEMPFDFTDWGTTFPLIEKSFYFPYKVLVLDCRVVVTEAFDGDYANLVKASFFRDGVNFALNEYTDSDLFIASVYQKLNYIEAPDAAFSSSALLYLAQTISGVAPTKGAGVVQIFYIRTS
jgi:hypothetical protein